MNDSEKPRDLRPGSTLIVNGEVVWVNPPGLGHAYIKLRKGVLEDQILYSNTSMIDIATLTCQYIQESDVHERNFR